MKIVLVYNMVVEFFLDIFDLKKFWVIKYVPIFDWVWHIPEHIFISYELGSIIHDDQFNWEKDIRNGRTWQ
jgi:hypothetical protein